MECFRLNGIRCLFLSPIRLRKTRVFLSVMVALAILHLYLFNCERFPHDRRIRCRDAGKMASLATLVTDVNLQKAKGSNSRPGKLGGYENRNKNSKNPPPVSQPSLVTTDDAERTDSYESSSRVTLISTNATKERSHGRCKEDTLLTRSNKHTYGTCTPHKAADDACSLAERLYFYDPSLSECKTNKEKGEICSLTTKIVKKRRVLKANCDSRICRKFETHKDSKSQSDSLIFGVFVLDPEEGLLRSARNFSQVSELETQLPRIALQSFENKFNFVFVKCFSAVNEQSLFSQLITIPAEITTEKAPKQRAKNTINVNIVLLDSVSRPHFYRSLPKTIQTFKTLTQRALSAKVFDFELFQAVHGHTTHNEHALFTGQLLPELDPEVRSPSVKPEVLFGQFKTAGYQTLWQDDLCWTGGWGLVNDLAADDWEELQSKLKESFVDNTGNLLTHNCYKPQQKIET